MVPEVFFFLSFEHRYRKCHGILWNHNDKKLHKEIKILYFVHKYVSAIKITIKSNQLQTYYYDHTSENIDIRRFNCALAHDIYELEWHNTLHQQLNYFQEYSIVKEHVVKNSFFEMSVPVRERDFKACITNSNNDRGAFILQQSLKKYVKLHNF